MIKEEEKKEIFAKPFDSIDFAHIRHREKKNKRRAKKKTWLYVDVFTGSKNRLEQEKVEREDDDDDDNDGDDEHGGDNHTIINTGTVHDSSRSFSTLH